jgi:patatin-like phospholipase/acyl hydrolase
MMKHKNNLGKLFLIVMSLFLVPIQSSQASEIKEDTSQASISSSANYGMPFTEEELKDVIDISAGGFVAPSEEETSAFIQQEGLNLLGTGQQASTKAKPRIGLSIDGGGIRGVMSAIWLRNLSITYQEDQETGINPRLHQVFDYVGGTSIGGIVALSVAADLNPESIVDLFDKHGGKIFSKEGRKKARFFDFMGLFGHRYSSHNLETLMKDQFGDQTLEDTKTNILITACTDDGHPWLFKREDTQRYKLWEIARSTSAAPTYFESYKPFLLNQKREPIFEIDKNTGKKINNHVSLVDGGIWINNPTTLVTASIVRYFNGGNFDPNNIYMLSLGTGDTEAKAIPQSAGKLHAASIIEALMNSHNRGNHMMMTQLLGDHYHRINPKLKQFIDLSDANSIGDLKTYAQQEENAQKIKAFVEQTQEIVREKLEQGD